MVTRVFLYPMLLLAAAAAVAADKYDPGPGRTLLVIGQTYKSEFAGYVGGFGKAPAGSSHYGELYSGRINQGDDGRGLEHLGGVAKAYPCAFALVAISWKDNPDLSDHPIVAGCRDSLDANAAKVLAWGKGTAGKPLMFVEAAPQPPATSSEAGFIDYLERLLGAVEKYDVRALAYINSDWNAHGWDARYWGRLPPGGAPSGQGVAGAKGGGGTALCPLRLPCDYGGGWRLRPGHGRDWRLRCLLRRIRAGG